MLILCQWKPRDLLAPTIPALELSPCSPGAQVVCGPQSRTLAPSPTDFSTVQAVQATMILSTILCCIAFLIFVLQLFRLKQGERFVLTSIIQLMACK